MKTVDVSTIKYPNNFIKNVILRLDIAPILTINESLDTRLHETIRPSFPRLEIVPATQVHTQFKDGSATAESTILNQYQFSTENKKRILTLSSSFITLILQDFKGFDDFISTLRPILGLFNTIYKPIVVNRLGLRYINEIVIKDGSPFDWNDYINKDLITNLNSELIVKGEVSRAMSQVIYKKEDYNITFSYGMSNSEFPNPISRKEFIIDIDCYTTEIEYERIDDALVNYNGSAVQIFENSIEEKLKEIMRSK